MKVRVCYTIEVDDDYRRALRHRTGKDGLATRQELQLHFYLNGRSMDDDLMYEHEMRDEDETESI
jgi:hypothetical protein